MFRYRLDRVIKQRGILDVLRRGVTDYGIHFNLIYFAPASGLNPEILELYNKNILNVTRQLHYSLKNNNSLDMVLSVNGLPLVTIELKNHLTGQTVENAKIQYRKDRDPAELIFQFNRRSLVHFAVDPDLAYITTRLAGDTTFFLPYNKGYENGAGNPPNPDGYKTAYLWRGIWDRDSLLDIFGRFMHLKKEEKMENGRRKVNEIMIFPRFHQLDAVRKMVFDVREDGVGKNYLVQHSTGSGKSISIAWLAHHFFSLHNKEDQLIFDSVIVITDRKILDQQLQETIYQFEHKHGVVQKIDKDSTQLARALESGSKIIITTLHKFPYVIEKIGSLPERKYTVIIDEGHRSFDKYIKENGYDEVNTLVAFSGTVKEKDVDKEYTGAGMNGFPQDELRERFNTDDYHVLIVANK